MPVRLKIHHWLLLLALLPHLALAAYFGNQFVPYPDQDAYLSAAENIIAGRGLSISFEALGGFIRPGEPTSYYGVGAPLFFASQIAIFGKNYFLLRIANIVLFGISLLFFRGICRFWMPERIANVAMLVMGLSPFYILFNQLFLTEMLFLCCELGAFFFLFKYFRSNEKRDLIFSALAIAFSLLVRTNLLFFLPIIAMAIGFKRGWLPSLQFVLLVLLVIAPYCIRNSLNSRAFFPFDGKAALNLWQFNSDVHDGGFWTEDFQQAPQMPVVDGLTEKQRADLLTGVGLNWIKENPGKFLRLAAMKGVRFLSPLPQTQANRKLAILLTPYSLFLMIGFAIGLSSLSPRNTEHVLIVLLFLYTLAIDMVFMSATRHRILYDPFFLLVAFKWISERRWPIVQPRLALQPVAGQD